MLDRFMHEGNASLAAGLALFFIMFFAPMIFAILKGNWKTP